MRAHPFSVCFESESSQIAAGRYNPGLEITFQPVGEKQKVTVAIGAGSRDSLYFYREKGSSQKTDRYFLVSIGWSLGYVGLEIFSWCQSEDRWDIETEYFLQGHILGATLGAKGLDLEPYTIAARMASCLE